MEFRVRKGFVIGLVVRKLFCFLGNVVFGGIGRYGVFGKFE